jgi:predicted DNA-binding transcriptional regulator AlpA
VEVYKTDEAKRNAAAAEKIEPGALSEPDAATFLGIGYRTLWGLRHDRKGPKYVRIGKSIRYPRHLLIEWLTDQATGGES